MTFSLDPTDIAAIADRIAAALPARLPGRGV